jgi:recombination protein RecA
MAKKQTNSSTKKSAAESMAPTPAAPNMALAAAIAAINKKHGEGSIVKLSNSGGLIKLGRQISSGSLTLDLNLGPFCRNQDGKWQTGFAGGRIVEIYGPEAQGKTTLLLHIIAQAQRKGGVAAFIDAEHTLDPNWAKRLGVNLDNALISQPSSGEQALQIAEDLIRSNAVDVIGIDSVPALMPKAMLEGEIGDATMGKQAKMMSEALSKFVNVMGSNHRTLVVFINQLREKLGILFGNPETTPGGKALRFYASYRLDVRRGDPIVENNVQIGFRMKVKTIKNKLSPPYQVSEFDFLYDLRPDMPAGIDRVAELLDLATAAGVIAQNGAYYYLGENLLGQGRRNAIGTLRGSTALMWETYERLMVKRLADRGYNPDLTPIAGMPSVPVVTGSFEPPTAEDLVLSQGQEDSLPAAA